jgi:hypothetical protein
MSSEFIIRLTVELPDKVTALFVGDAVKERLAHIGAIKQSEIKRYRLNSERFRCWFLLEAKSDTPSNYEELLSALAEGWECHDFSVDDHRAVWHPGPGKKFFVPYVRWAEVETISESSPVPVNENL